MLRTGAFLCQYFAIVGICNRHLVGWLMVATCVGSIVAELYGKPNYQIVNNLDYATNFRMLQLLWTFRLLSYEVNEMVLVGSVLKQSDTGSLRSDGSVKYAR